MQLNQLCVKNVRSKERTNPLQHLSSEELKTISGGGQCVYLDNVNHVFRVCNAYD